MSKVKRGDQEGSVLEGLDHCDVKGVFVFSKDSGSMGAEAGRYGVSGVLFIKAMMMRSMGARHIIGFGTWYAALIGDG